MKKSIVFIMVLVALVATLFVGCKKEAPAFRVDVFWYTYADTFLASVRNAMTEELDKAGIRAFHHDSQNNQAIQLQSIQSAITRGTNALIVNIVTTGSDDAAMNIVNIAKDAGIPLIWFNREVANEVVDAYNNSVFVGTDADEAGVMQGEAIADFLLRPENWADNKSIFDLDGNGRINYIMFRGEHGNAEAFGRTLYSVQEANRLLAGSGLSLAPSPANLISGMYPNDGVSNFFLYGNWSAAEAGNLMRTALTAHSLTTGAIELIIANNDDQALGAIEAMNEQGFNTGRAGSGYIPVFGVDATAVAQETIRAGRMTGSVLQDAGKMAETVVSLIVNLKENLPLLYDADQFNIDEGVAKIRVPYSIYF